VSSGPYVYPPGPLTRFRRGVVSGLGCVATALILAAIPSLSAWLFSAADGTRAMSALRAGAVATLAGNLGGVRLGGVLVTVPPALISVALGALLVASVRRIDGRCGLAGLVLGYAFGSFVLAHWSRFGATYAPAGRTFVAALLFGTAVCSGAFFAQPIRARLPHRWQQVIRAAAVAALAYVGTASLLVAASLGMHLNAAADLQGDLASGGGGLPVLLLGLASVPNAIMAAIGYLSGAGFTVGSHTSVSIFDVSHGRVPTFPLLAGLPSGEALGATGLGLVVVIAMGVGWLVWRAMPKTGRVLARFVDILAVAVLVGAAAAALTSLTEGDLGDKSLRHVGGTWWACGPWVALAVAGATTTFMLCEVGWHWWRRGDHDVGIALSRLKARDDSGSDGRDEPAAADTADDKLQLARK